MQECAILQSHSLNTFPPSHCLLKTTLLLLFVPLMGSFNIYYLLYMLIWYILANEITSALAFELGDTTVYNTSAFL